MWHAKDVNYRWSPETQKNTSSITIEKMHEDKNKTRSLQAQQIHSKV